MSALLLAPPAFARGKAKNLPVPEEKPKQEVIHLDVSKDEGVADTKNDWIQKDISRDNVDTEFSIFDNLIDTDKDSDHPFKIEEESLFGKIYKKKLERTSIPSFLLKDELTFKYKKGIVDKVQFYGAYQGNFSSNFVGSDYDTDYDFGFMEAGVIGDFKDKNTDFKLQLNFKPSKRVLIFRALYCVT